MTKADNDTITTTTPRTPSRRVLLTGASAALLAGATALTSADAAPAVPVGADGADAELIRLHLALVAQTAEIRRLETEPDASPDGGVTPESVAEEVRMNAAEHRFGAIAAQIIELPAQGVAGWRAKAGALLLVLEHGVCTYVGDTLDDIASGEVGDEDHRMSLSLARDIVGVGRAVA